MALFADNCAKFELAPIVAATARQDQHTLAMYGLSVASYGLASAAFLTLTLLLATSWQGRAQGARLIAAAGMSTVWAAALAAQAWLGPLRPVELFTFELLRAGVWLVALVGLAQGILPRFLAMGCHVLWIGLLSAGWLLALFAPQLLQDGGLAALLVRTGLILALAVLVILEQIYRNSNATGRFGLKFLAIGIGGVFAYDLFLYSQAELLGSIPEDVWVARGFVNALLVPFVAVAARRNPQWSLDVFVSRQAVVFTAVLMAAGIYLLLMAAGGYYVRQVGGRWGALASVVFLAGAGLVLAVILLSGTVRRRLRVFVSKHFYRNKYDYRIEWLRFVETLAGGDDEDLRRTCLRAIAQVFESPGAVLYGRGDSGSQFLPLAAWPMRLDQLPGLAAVTGEHELVRFVADRQWVIDLKERASTPEVYQNVAWPEGLRGDERIRVLLPLLEPKGLAGFVLLFDPPPPFELTYEDRDLLKTLGRHVATLLAQHEADRRLAESRQFEAYHRLTAFMMHDLKNSVAQLQLVVRNAEKHRHNPEFVDDAIGTIGNAVERMTRLIDQLRDKGRSPVAAGVDVVHLARSVATRCADRLPAAILKRAPQVAVVRGDPERLATSLEHLIRNAQDACRPVDTIAIEVVAEARRVRLSVIDSGSGMTVEFLRERLFRPFDSTKGSKGMGIGAFQVREYARGLGGDVEVQSSPGSGTRFDIILPAGDAVSA